MIKIGITGNIAAGKSVVEGLLLAKGYEVIDADKIAHRLSDEQPAKDLIIKAFAEYDLLDDADNISRKKLGDIVFRNEQERLKLEKILHPFVIEEIKTFFEQKKDIDAPVFVSIPLLFEAKLENFFDKIVLIYADNEIRKKRLMNRNKLTSEQAQNRIDIQMDQEKKKHLSGFIIFNNGRVEDLKSQVDAFEAYLFQT